MSTWQVCQVWRWELHSKIAQCLFARVRKAHSQAILCRGPSPCADGAPAAEQIQQEAHIKQQLQHALLRHLAGQHRAVAAANRSRLYSAQAAAVAVGLCLPQCSAQRS